MHLLSDKSVLMFITGIECKREKAMATNERRVEMEM